MHPLDAHRAPTRHPQRLARSLYSRWAGRDATRREEACWGAGGTNETSAPSCLVDSRPLARLVGADCLRQTGRLGCTLGRSEPNTWAHFAAPKYRFSITRSSRNNGVCSTPWPNSSPVHTAPSRSSSTSSSRAHTSSSLYSSHRRTHTHTHTHTSHARSIDK